MRPSTTEYNNDDDDDDDDDCTIHRTLSAAMRAAVTALAGDVDTQYVYTTTTDGSDLTDVYGPLDVVQLANGTPGSYRQHHPQLLRDGNPSAHLVTETLSLGRYLFRTEQRAPRWFCSERGRRCRLLRVHWEVRLRAFCGCRGKQRPDLPARDDLVDGSVLHGLLGGQDEVAVGVLGHALERLPCMGAMIPFISSRLRTNSLAWIANSVVMLPPGELM
jgi:hypothetical protein